MKAFRILIVLLLIVAGIAGGYWLSQSDMQFGQVLVRAGGYDFSTSLPKLGVLLLIFLLLLALVWKLFSLPFNAWIRHRRKKGRIRLNDGLIALDEGQWHRAERLLAVAAKDVEVGVAALGGAIRAADAQGDDALAQKHLQRLGKRNPAMHALVQAERLLARQHPESALDMLDDAALQPPPPRALLLRVQALSALGRFGEAYGLLGPLKRTEILVSAELTALENRLARESLRETADTNFLAERWEGLSKSLRKEPSVVAVYAERAASLGWDDAALRSLEKAIDAQWDESLVALYGRLPIGTENDRYAVAQRWENIHPNSPGLLVTLGKLARQQRHWDQAQHYLRDALAHGAGADAWEALGDGYVADGDEVTARHCYANALRASRGESVTGLPDRDLREKIKELATPEDRNEHGFPKLSGY
ncbi:MAG: heme biosynthesis protein HemY [Xanthomonadaceae bacterium]|jgi:HemY protein|nr:heme biosynthesis protein HemY [Xanthomonadaceae bacterium]